MEHKYTAHQAEIDYKIIVNTKGNESPVEAYRRVKESLSKTNGYCPCKIDKNPDTKCQCREFRESEEGGDCSCGFFSKIARTDSEKIKYCSEPNFNTQRTGRKSNKEKEAEKLKREQDLLESGLYQVTEEDL